MDFDEATDRAINIAEAAARSGREICGLASDVAAVRDDLLRAQREPLPARVEDDVNANCMAAEPCALRPLFRVWDAGVYRSDDEGCTWRRMGRTEIEDLLSSAFG